MFHCIRIALLAGLLLGGVDVHSQALVLLPSAAVDQRFDDNYRLVEGGSESVSATRLVANLGLNRESAESRIRGLLRADALLSVGQNTPDELDSNQFAFVESKSVRPRSSFGIRINFKNDTPNRDISTDITDVTATPSDSGAAVSQDENVDRKRLLLNPEFSYSLSRRSDLDLDIKYTDVDHADRSCGDAFAAYVEGLLELDPPQAAQPGAVFTTTGELDDFTDNTFGIAFRHSLSSITSFSAGLTYSEFEADETISDDWVRFADKQPDTRCRNVLRNPRFPTSVDTTRFVLGYEKQFSETVSGSGQIGYYVADSRKLREDNPETDFSNENFDPDNPDASRPVLNPGDPDYDPAVLSAIYEDKSSSGYLFNLSLSKKTSTTTYSGKVGVEVFPSDIGDVVESLELIGEMTRQLNPRLVFNFRMRAFEPDAISDEADDDEFARRFLSIEPKLVWNVSRSVTVGGSYRYRRQKTQASPRSSQSNALLLSIKYSPLVQLNELAE